MVLVQIAVAGVNFMDIGVRLGLRTRQLCGEDRGHRRPRREGIPRLLSSADL
jgi:hypothetical protein